MPSLQYLKNRLSSLESLLEEEKTRRQVMETELAKMKETLRPKTATQADATQTA